MKRRPESHKEIQEQLDELEQLVSRILSIGRDLRVPLTEVLDTQDEEAAWSGLGILEQNLLDKVYEGNSERISTDLELAQEYLSIVFPRIESVLDLLNTQASSLKHYSAGLSNPR